MVERPATAPRLQKLLGAAGGTLLSLLLVSSPVAAAQEVFEGPARIVDGDTLYIGKDKVRLYGVDAPEKAQTCRNSKGQPYDCGKLSLAALTEHVGNASLRCEVKNKDQYGRNVAACFLPRGWGAKEDIGQWLVSNGHALAYRAYSKDYIAAEDQAHAEKVGVWQGDFTMPADWRKQQRSSTSAGGAPGSTLPSQGTADTASSLFAMAGGAAGAGLVEAGRSYASVVTAAIPGAPVVAAAGLLGAVEQPVLPAPPVRCLGPVIKGNINAKGEKIYHTPKSGSYDRVLIELDKGERFFCSEEEAKAAGWRPAIK